MPEKSRKHYRDSQSHVAGGEHSWKCERSDDLGNGLTLNLNYTSEVRAPSWLHFQLHAWMRYLLPAWPMKKGENRMTGCLGRGKETRDSREWEAIFLREMLSLTERKIINREIEK